MRVLLRPCGESMLAHELLLKIDEQIERTDHLISCVTESHLSWTPPVPGAWSVGELLGHLPDCVAGFCAVLYSAFPDQLAPMRELRNVPVNTARTAAEARVNIALFRAAIETGFAVVTDADLARKIPTVFVPQGETLLTLLLGNLEHLINHKHQLFTLLKLMGAEVSSGDLYRFRG